MYFGREPYGLDGYIEYRGDGNMLRGETFGQPNTLQVGDVLANGLELIERPHEGGNGSVLLYFTDGTHLSIAARVPLLLEGGISGKLPIDLAIGDIFETGSVVLNTPSELAEDDPRYRRHQYEVDIAITGGLDGHSIQVPKDLIIALHDEVYPPSQNSLLGAYAIKETLSMGARARRNLPNYGRLDTTPEPERLIGVLKAIDTLRSKAQEERSAYRETLAILQEQCDGLRGVELLITGRLYGRNNTRIYSTDPLALVENMHVEVTSATVNNYEGQGGLVDQHLPFIEFQGRIVEDGGHVSAWLGVGKFGVKAELVEPPTLAVTTD